VLRYVAASYTAEASSLYRGVVKKCDEHYVAYYFDVLTTKELYIEDTVTWEDHWGRVAEHFSLAIDPEDLTVMELYAEVTACTEEQKLEQQMNNSGLKAAKHEGEAQVYTIEKIKVAAFAALAAEFKKQQPSYEWWLTVGPRCDGTGAVAIIQGPNATMFYTPKVEGPEELWEQAAPIWPEVTDWWGVNGTRAQLPLGVCVDL